MELFTLYANKSTDTYSIDRSFFIHYVSAVFLSPPLCTDELWNHTPSYAVAVSLWIKKSDILG